MTLPEVGQWVAQTQPFIHKLPEITDFGLRIGQDSELAKFWLRAVIMKKLTMLLSLACLESYFIKVLQRLSSEFV